MKALEKKHMMIWGAITIVLMGGSFYFGTSHGKTVEQATMMQARSGMGGGMSGRNRFGGGGNVIGDVLSKDATSITVKTRDGSSKIVIYTGSTQILKTTAGAIDDVAVGSTVMVQGTQNTDGSVTATSVAIRPSQQDTNNQKPQ